MMHGQVSEGGRMGVQKRVKCTNMVYSAYKTICNVPTRQVFDYPSNAVLNVMQFV